jgi:Putative MetA-pathway of phenol degradation
MTKIAWRGAPPVLLLLALSRVCFAQSPPDATIPEIVTDRPDVTESSIVVPKGSLQIENGATLTTDHGFQTFDLSESLIRLGISTKTEIRLVVPNYLGGFAGSDATGFGDVALGMKQQLGPLSPGFDLAVIVAVSIPTGSSQVSSHGYDPFVKFPWSKELKSGWSIGGMQSLFWNTDDHRRNGDWEPTFYVEKEITKSWDAFVEYAGDFFQHGGPSEIAHFGTAYRITGRQQIDFHFGFGISDAAPRHFFAVGYSLRIDKLLGR